ncbi:hypothetical protein NUW54_g11950 [Trametes sanguinea]|uniref:Uncharacterized protein n=1 Tax=Trametes sanguinea TaxID=158606 RepID=A0ACC1N506_9APHY|nr:hypothetical protein NUW54_g11950 [Trametes sanguinea]
MGRLNLLDISTTSIPSITTTYEAKFALDAVNFCLLERLPGQHGIGILTPSEEDHDLDLLDFKIDVRFPLPRRRAHPHRVKSFETAYGGP